MSKPFDLKSIQQESTESPSVTEFQSSEKFMVLDALINLELVTHSLCFHRQGKKSRDIKKLSSLIRLLLSG